MNDADGHRELRNSVRELVDRWLKTGRYTPACDSWLRSFDAEFSRELGARGLIGTTWPVEYGGTGKPGISRLVITEELLRFGAPVAAHWIADRQIGPSILRHGTEAAKQRYLPQIATGELTFCLGMSETESGSDLASVRTTAERIEGGWSIRGRKIWTSQAHNATHAYVLARTAKTAKKHEGLSEFIVDMNLPGVEVRPIYDLAGEHHFNEVTFDDVKVYDDHVIGKIGNGWEQVTSQLSLERGGIERVLSTYPLLAAALEHQRRLGELDRAAAIQSGKMLARLGALRAVAVQVALDIDAGGSPVMAAAVLKGLGTAYEKDVNEFARSVLDTEADPEGTGSAGLLAGGIISSPGFTVRGGTSEVLKTLVSRGASQLVSDLRARRSDLASAVNDVVGDAGGEPEDQEELRQLADQLGWARVAVPEEAGGEGGDLSDAVEIIGSLGRLSVSTSVAESIAALRALARGGSENIDRFGRITIATNPGVRVTPEGDGIRLDGTSARVPWGIGSDAVLVVAEQENGETAAVLVPADIAGLEWASGTNLAGEPRDTLALSDVRLSGAAVIGSDAPIVVEAALFRAVAMLGALETALAKAVEHVSTREQFGRPLIKFQAVAGLLAEVTGSFLLARAAVEQAIVSVEAGGDDVVSRVAAARVVVSEAATSGAELTHQMHAAMGVTREHPLHLSTRRLWSWRDEIGTADSWAERLGKQLNRESEAGIWAWLTEERS